MAGKEVMKKYPSANISSASLFKRCLKTKTFFKNFLRRISEDRRDAEGVLFLRPPPIPFISLRVIAHKTSQNIEISSVCHNAKLYEASDMGDFLTFL